MTPDQFRAWRKERRWSQRQAADALGISVRMIAYYETGIIRSMKHPAPIPRAVALACAALALGLRDFPAQQT